LIDYCPIVNMTDATVLAPNSMTELK